MASTGLSGDPGFFTGEALGLHFVVFMCHWAQEGKRGFRRRQQGSTSGKPAGHGRVKPPEGRLSLSPPGVAGNQAVFTEYVMNDWVEGGEGISLSMKEPIYTET